MSALRPKLPLARLSNVEIKQVDLTESMIRAIARQAEAERERRAKVIHAEGELQASEKLFQAAKILSQEPQAILLRYLETLTVIGADKNTTIVFPLPLMVGLAEYFAFYNGERPHQSLGNKMPDVVCRTGMGGGAMIVDKFGGAGEEHPVPLRYTGVSSPPKAGSEAKATTTKAKARPGQRRPAASEVECAA